MNTPIGREGTKSPSGKLTYAFIDGPDDKWIYAIVTDYQDCQTYGEILVGFDAECLPEDSVLWKILEALDS